MKILSKLLLIFLPLLVFSNCDLLDQLLDQNGSKTISFASPYQGQIFTGETNLGVVVNVINSRATNITNVDLYLDSNLVRSEYGNKTTYTWGTANASYTDNQLLNLQPNTYTLRAEAKDDQSNSYTAVTTFTIKNENNTGSNFSVKITSPSSGSNFNQGETINVIADIQNESDSNIQRVEFKKRPDGGSYSTFGTDYSASWTKNTTISSTGLWDIKVVAYHDDGTTKNDTISINIKPDSGNGDCSDDFTVSFTSPLANEQIPVNAEFWMNININNTTNSCIKNVVFSTKLDGESWVQLVTDSSAPWEAGLKIVDPGFYTLQAKVTNVNGVVKTKERRIEIYELGGGCSDDFTVSFTSPLANEQIPAYTEFWTKININNTTESCIEDVIFSAKIDGGVWTILDQLFAPPWEMMTFGEDPGFYTIEANVMNINGVVKTKTRSIEIY